MEQFKNTSVVLLPTNGNANLCIICEGKLKGKLFTYNNISEGENFNYQHLYFISDEVISYGEENVWYFDSNFNKVTKWIGESDTYVNKWFKKIISTTDKSLLIEDKSKICTVNGDNFKSLPQPSQQWIEYFIGEYNTGRIIKEILIENNEPCCKCDTSEKLLKCPYNGADIEGTCWAPNPNNDFYGLNIKINSDNTINIKYGDV